MCDESAGRLTVWVKDLRNQSAMSKILDLYKTMYPSEVTKTMKNNEKK